MHGVKKKYTEGNEKEGINKTLNPTPPHLCSFGLSLSTGHKRSGDQDPSQEMSNALTFSLIIENKK